MGQVDARPDACIVASRLSSSCFLATPVQPRGVRDDYFFLSPSLISFPFVLVLGVRFFPVFPVAHPAGSLLFCYMDAICIASRHQFRMIS
jgi:hypothetical protein